MTVVDGNVSRKFLTKSRETTHLKLLVIACLLGIVMGVVFIVIQPLFGMETLTSRHAAAYQQIGSLGSVTAISIAWFAHILVSVFYGLLCGLVLIKTSSLQTIILFNLLFTWITTIIAPKANAMIVQVVSLHKVQLGSLPSLNFSLDAKFALHLVFFAVISLGLYFYKKRIR
jgi:hypothetical protein